MAVTESSGNGYALYNGVKLPVLPAWDKEVYPYAVIARNSSSGTIKLMLFDSVHTTNSSGTASLYPNDVFTLTDGTWENTGSGGLNNVIFWANYDVYYGDGVADLGGTVYLAASDPISLDGMNVIEWDGDTTGLSVLLEFPYDMGTYYVVDSNIIPSDDAIDGIFVAEGIDADNNTLRAVYTISASTIETDGSFWTTNPYGVASGTLNGNSGTGFLSSEFAGVSTHTSLFAYRTSAEETYDKTTFLSGLAMGLCGKGNPTFEGSDVFSKGYSVGAKLRRKRVLPTKYSYNGTVLPDINKVWTDKATYPYASVGYHSGQDTYYVRFTSSVTYVSSLDGTASFGGIPTEYPVFKLVDGVWSSYTGWLSATVIVKWSNADVYVYDDAESDAGAFYLAASDPIPVYE